MAENYYVIRIDDKPEHEVQLIHRLVSELGLRVHHQPQEKFEIYVFDLHDDPKANVVLGQYLSDIIPEDIMITLQDLQKMVLNKALGQQLWQGLPTISSPSPN